MSTQNEDSNQINWQWGFQGKTFWDLMKDIIIPIAQAILIPILLLYLSNSITSSQQTISDKASQKQHDTDIQIAQDQQSENQLSNYLDSMATLLLQSEVRNNDQAGADIRSLARARTLTILNELHTSMHSDNQNGLVCDQEPNVERKTRVVKFLYDSGLINRDPFPIVSLAGADLNCAALQNMHLSGANLAKADLSYANLSEATLIAADLSQASLSHTNLSNAQLMYAPIIGADLSNTNLSGTDLSGADLTSTDLSSIIITGDTDITGTTGDFSNSQTSTAKPPSQWKLIQTDTTVLIAYNEGSTLPVFGKLDLNTSRLQLVYGPLSGWSTAIVLLPAFWSQESCPTDYCETAPITILNTSTQQVQIDASGLHIPLGGTIAGLDVSLMLDFLPPGSDSIDVNVSVNAPGASKIVLDSKHPDDFFKAVVLRSMHFSTTQWFTQQAYVDNQSFSLPTTFTRLIHAQASTFGLTGGTSDAVRNAPTIKVTMKDPIDLQVTAEVQQATSPGVNNVSLWGTFTDVNSIQDSWSYTVTASNPYASGS